MRRDTAVIAGLLALVLAGAPIILLYNASAVTFGNAFTTVGSTSTDFRPTLYSITNDFIARVDQSTVNVATDDAWYLFIRSTHVSTVEPNSIRIVAPSGFSYATYVASGSTDDPNTWTNPDQTGSPLTVDFTGNIKWFDSDGRAGFTDGDMIYWSNPLTTQGCGSSGNFVRICDLRLTSGTVASTALTAGTIVKSGEADRADANTFGTCTLDLKYYDANANFAVDSGDPVYIVPVSGADCFPTGNSVAQATGFAVPMVHDTRLVPWSSYTAGTKVKKSDTDWTATLHTPSATSTSYFDCISSDNNGGAASTYSGVDLFLVRDTSCDSNAAVAAGDVILFRSGDTAGVVATTQTDSIAARTTFSDKVFGVDYDGNGIYSSGDGVYWNRPSSSDWGSATSGTTVSAGDLRLTTVTAGSCSSCTAGTVVASGAGDITGSSGAATFTVFVLKWFDDDRQTGVGVQTADEIYVGRTAVGTASIPQLNDVSLRASFGTKVSSSTTGWVPTLTTVTASQYVAARADLSSPGTIIDDILYINGPGQTTTAGVGSVRLIGYDSTKTAGSQVKTGDFDIGQAVTQQGGSCISGASGVTACIGFVNNGGSSFYESNDLIYYDGGGSNSLSIGSAGFSNYDVRLNAYTIGSTTVAAGTLTISGEVDVNTYQGTALAEPPCRKPVIKLWDDNQDTLYNVGDTLYITFDTDSTDSGAPNSCPSSAIGSTSVTARIPRSLDIRVSGSGGASSPTGGAVSASPAAVLPTLATGTASAVCVASGASVTYTVVYTDSQNRAPTVSKVALNSVDNTMTTTATSYTGGATYTKAVTAPTAAGSYTGTFTFTNAGGTATLAAPAIVVAPSTNVAPTLSSGSVTPTSGGADTNFTWKVTYTDTNNNAPSTAKVTIDGAAKNMTTTDTTYCDGAEYTYKGKAAVGAHDFVFEFSDGTNAAVKLPATNTSAGPTVTAASGASSNSTSSSAAGSSSKKPTPGFEAALVVAAAVAALVVVAARRRND